MATTFWFFELVHVTSLQKQQEVLYLLQGVTGLTAFGASAGPHHIVSFRCADQVMKSVAEVLLDEIDPDAVCIYDSGPIDAEPVA